MNEFQDRLLFGTDMCLPNANLPLAGFLTRLVEERKLSEDVFRKIARDNAIRLLELS